MRCVNCQSEIPAGSRYCLNCGAAQTQAAQRETIRTVKPTSADGGGDTASPWDENTTEEFSWLAREAQLDRNLDYETQGRYEGTAGQVMGCLGIAFFVVVGLIALIPAVPLLAVFGIPLAIILGLLTFFNVWQLADKVRRAKFLSFLPGLTNRNPRVVAICLSAYLTVASVISLFLMIASSHRR